MLVVTLKHAEDLRAMLSQRRALPRVRPLKSSRTVVDPKGEEAKPSIMVRK